MKLTKVRKRQIILEILNFFVAGVLVAVIAIQGNRLMAQQNKIAELEFSPAINVVRTYIYNEEAKIYDTIEIQVYNQNFPISEFSGKGQCILRFYTKGGEKDYLLEGVFFANAYSHNTSGLLLRSYEPNNNLNISRYVENCLENCKEIVNIKVFYYYRFEYKDAFGTRHERYFDLTDHTKPIELYFKEGKTLFEFNNNLESLDYFKDNYPTF